MSSQQEALHYEGSGRGKEEERLSKPYRNHHTNFWLYSLEVGFFAGLIWGIVRWLCYEMKLTMLVPGLVAEPFFLTSYLKTGWGIAVGIASFIVFSIIATYLYYFVLGKVRGPWAGIGYGIFWWLVWFGWIGPMLKFIKPMNVIGWDTITTEFCVFLMWGLFIGYTIAFEFTDEASREPSKAR
ncbi:YqhR family membrane protein [Paenibacillus protaetiae]|uniref:DUF1440 domain-containing protein n=1 Tax=Paenibacillus protaetiae TaxID=2509456 RepID=A0A4V0YF28_9BACL|nr:YqhR family membrane protein [Paenibacillus protaetiae]QAY66261.1 hypothetical protein ET464_07445 [Paenibacillus protaetiae]